MPTYEFRCEAGHTFDRFLKMSEAPLVLDCAQCGKPAQRQMSGGAGLVFKGSGFYLTDYGRAGQKQPAAEGGSAAAGDTKTGDTKTGDTKTGDSKPAKTESSTAPASTAPAKSEKSSSTKSPKPSE